VDAFAAEAVAIVKEQPKYNRRVPKPPGRKLLWPERMTVKFPSGTLARIAAVLKEGELRIELARDCILEELRRREAQRPARTRKGRRAKD
jgi:hypothetical protein